MFLFIFLLVSHTVVKLDQKLGEGKGGKIIYLTKSLVEG